MTKKRMAKEFKTLTKSKVSPKIVIGVIILVGLIGLSFVGASLLSTVGITISNTNDNPKGGGESGLIAYYSLDEGSGNTANDKMIKNNGTIYGAQWTNNSILGKALNFNSTNNYIEIPNNAVLNQTEMITVSAWIKLNKTVAEQTYQHIIINKSDWNNKDGYQLLLNKPYSSNLIFRILYENSFKDVTWDASGLQTDAWYYIVGTYDKNKKEAKLYVDGELKNISYLDKSIDTTSSNLIVGGKGANYFNGAIDEVKVYVKALSEEEIYDYYQKNHCQRYTDIDYKNLTSKQYEYLTNFPLSLSAADSNRIKTNFPWINTANPSICDKVFLMGFEESVINSSFNPY
jgi:hypothetical protein